MPAKYRDSEKLNLIIQFRLVVAIAIPRPSMPTKPKSYSSPEGKGPEKPNSVTEFRLAVAIVRVLTRVL